MEFLHSSMHDQNHVILLLVISARNQTKIRYYEWDSSTHVSQASERRTQRIPDDQQLPLLLIPLIMETAFMLVFENRIVTYTDILTGHAKTYPHQLEHFEEPEEPGSSRAKPVFTQWARTMRRADHVSLQDNIYLCREDGVVRFLEISNSIDSMIDSSHAAGRLRINFSTAFASLDLGARCVDYLVAGGDQSDGGLWKFAPRQTVTTPVETIRNWTPSIDLVAVHVPRHRNRRSLNTEATGDPLSSQKRLFACTGRSSLHGAITEIRQGIEASISFEGYSAGRGVNRIWALHDCSEKCIQILVSYPTQTVTFSTGSETKSEDSEDDLMQDVDDESQIYLEAETLAAGTTDDGCMVQITPYTIRVIQPGNRQRRLVRELDDAHCVLKASVLRSDTFGFLLIVAVKHDNGPTIRVARFRTDEPDITMENLGKPWLLGEEPSLVSLEETRGNLITLIGTLTGSLQVFTWNGSTFVHVITHSFQGEFAICHTIAMISDVPQYQRLVCGLRDGTIRTLILKGMKESRWGIQSVGDLVVGSTSVSVIADLRSPHRVILACGDTFCTLEYGPRSDSPPKLNKIWITHRDNLGYCQKEIIAICQADPAFLDESSASVAEQLFCVDGDEFCVLDLGRTPQPQMVPRRINLDGTPSRVIHSEILGKLIVLYSRTVVTRPSQGAGQNFRAGQRAIQPLLAFLEPDKSLEKPGLPAADNYPLSEPGSETPANVYTIYERKQGERFLGMIEWFPSDGKNAFHMLVVHTKIDYVDDRAPTGRLLFFSLSLKHDNEVVMNFKKSTDLKAPVFAIAPYGSSSIVYSCGNVIHLHTLDLGSATRRWLAPTSFSLRSRGTCISVNAPFIYVSTASESLSVLKVEESDDEEAAGRKLVFQYSDEVAREGIAHLEIAEQGLLLASSKDCMVVGLWMPPDRRINNSLSTIFKLDLPSSITRFRRLKRSAESGEARKLPDGRLADPVIGCSTDGSLYQMELLNEPSWRLLRFVVNMAKRHPVICPFRDIYISPHQERFKSRIEPSLKNSRHRHVNGDILVRLLDHGAGDLLVEMLEREPGDDNLVVDFESAGARQRRFRELLEDAGFQNDMTSLEPVVSWLRRLLDFAL